MFVCCECCVLSGRGLCDEMITRSGESYRLWRVVVCDHETSRMRRLKPATGLWKYNHKGCNAKKTNKHILSRSKMVLVEFLISILASRCCVFRSFQLHTSSKRSDIFNCV